ncbi:MAG: hypothetical protein QN168_02080 [Armatimonadota bacterium]|nr:hypothetical protein [Armatimonadota bacterium]
MGEGVTARSRRRAYHVHVGFRGVVVDVGAPHELLVEALAVC